MANIQSFCVSFSFFLNAKFTTNVSCFQERSNRKDTSENKGDKINKTLQLSIIYLIFKISRIGQAHKNHF